MKKLLSHSVLWVTLAAFKIAASPVTFSAPTADRWMYPFNASPGTRASAPVFGAPGEADFDERDGQFLIGYDTSTQIAPGLGAANYQILSATLTLRHDGADIVYDPSQDSYTSYLDSGAMAYQADSDAGRPIELFGAGFRNGFDGVSFGEDGPFAPAGPQAAGVRNAYPVGFHNGVAVDVSNSLDHLNEGAAGFDPILFGLDTVVGLNPGDTLSAGMEVEFQLNLDSPLVNAFLQEQLNQGWVGLVATSIHESSFGGSPAYPSFETKENLVGQAGILELDVHVIPEPTALVLLGAGLLVLNFLWRGKRKE
ncbi:MAG: PEP-CTERM sorting domain-containing protein [Kiritimatiellae bacterium]|jgi:hypothetical protein|nr:PEP-CTERM sorting domain-containing protein [Kiritimatiellia bacterium]